MTSLGISVADRDGVRYVTLDRPDKKNALTAAMYAALADAIESASRDDVGAILLSGSGTAFTAGNDLRDFLEQPPHGDDAPVFRFLYALASTDVPIVAAVRGPAIGIGTTMLLHCDVVYATRAALFRVPFVDLGLVPEAASSLLLPQRIGRAQAGAAFFLGEAINAETARTSGIVTAIVDDIALDETAEGAAKAIAAKPREAVRETKRLMTGDREAVLERIRLESTAFRTRLGSDEARNAMAAFFQRAVR